MIAKIPRARRTFRFPAAATDAVKSARCVCAGLGQDLLVEVARHSATGICVYQDPNTLERYKFGSLAREIFLSDTQPVFGSIGNTVYAVGHRCLPGKSRRTAAAKSPSINFHRGNAIAVVFDF